MKSLLISFLVLTSINSLLFAQNNNDFYKGTIFKTDGSKINAKIQVPERGEQKKVSFYEGDVKKEISSEEVKSIEVISTNGLTYYFDRVNSIQNLKKQKISKDKYLLLAIVKSEKGSAYITPSKYVTTKDGNIATEYVYPQGADIPTFNYYLRKKGEQNASFLGMTTSGNNLMGINGVLKKQAKYLLKDNEELLSKILNGELKHSDLPLIVSTYLEAE
ncbi:hypothetical protein MY04_2193 [Flammeovirga sp. MY04]|uniref:hypothetical protein n=1 Tax=Flammeovirga sp. MY04 TaxID=1191459 RepID=UPI000806093F|nr:hypothetical protein [Flammeovirga sp. MY04]ANQ49567.1 hypothetical protein MY04_2193 [Flammeovirga sp. MY04]